MKKNKIENNKDNRVVSDDEKEIIKRLKKKVVEMYDRSIVEANKDVLIRKTTERIDDLIYQFKKFYISKTELFKQIEALRCKNYIIDGVIYEKLKFVRKNFCGKKKPYINKNRKVNNNSNNRYKNIKNNNK